LLFPRNPNEVGREGLHETTFNIPHRTSHGMCPVNGITTWFIGAPVVIGQMSSWGQNMMCICLPSLQCSRSAATYTGISTPCQHRLAELFEADFTESENRVQVILGKALQVLRGCLVLGPMDMFIENDVKRYACFACINYLSRAIQIQSKCPIRSNTHVNDRYHHRLVTFKDIAQQR
jgi:hypothetical protein